MTQNINNNNTFLRLITKILICFLLLLQIFPPLWVQDITSLRHFLIALFDIGAFSVIAVSICKSKELITNPFKFKPLFIFLLLIIWMAISIIWAMNKVESIAVLNRWFLVFAAALMTGLLLTDNRRMFHILIYCTIVITFINVLTCIIGYYHFDLHISQRRNLMLNGGYGNKNIFAVCLLLKLPLLYYAVLRYNRVWKIISLILIAAVCFCLIVLSTRSTFIGLFMQLFILLIYMFLAKFRFKQKNKYILYIGIVIICALSGFFIGNKFIEYNYNKYAKHNIKNNYTVAARLKTIEEKNSKGRLLIWKNTLEIIKKHPIFGYGVGNHKLAIMQVEAKQKNNYIVSDHAHNDFLEMQSELGVFGELLYILLYISMAVAGLKMLFSKKIKEPYRLIVLCSLLILITYMNDACFNFPNERASSQIYLILSIALMMFVYFRMFSIKEKLLPIKIKPLILKIVVICMSIIMISTLYIETCHFVSSIVQHQRILCHNSGNKNKILPTHWVNIAPWLPNIDESTKPIAINNAMMFALEGDYRTAINMVLKDNANPYYALKEYRLASYYAHLQIRDSSDYWADKCIEKKPLCYDPVSVKVGNCKRAGDISGAIKNIENYLKREQKEERAWLSLINIYLQQDNYIKAEEIYQQFLVNNSENNTFLAKKKEIEALKTAKNY